MQNNKSKGKFKRKTKVLSTVLALTVATSYGVYTQFFDGEKAYALYNLAQSIVEPAAGELHTVESKELAQNPPEHRGKPYVKINNNVSNFSEEQKNTQAVESFSRLDSLGRCGMAFANIGPELMPTEERTSIGMIKPSGWHTVRYDDIVEGKYLYNRCHLIGYQLTGENANEQNLITGTRYMNVDGMLPWENMVADYIEDTGNHVLYRVTPIFAEDELVARGVQMEAYSVEDDGKGVSFNVFVFNVQPGIAIDYATGESSMVDTVSTPGEKPEA